MMHDTHVPHEIPRKTAFDKDRYSSNSVIGQDLSCFS